MARRPSEDSANPGSSIAQTRMPSAWLELIDKAAKVENITRSAFISRAAHEAAKTTIGAIQTVSISHKRNPQ